MLIIGVSNKSLNETRNTHKNVLFFELR